MLSPQSKYALRAMIFLSKQNRDDFMKVEDIAAATDLPAPYMSKIFKALAAKEIIISRRGKNGGVQINTKRDRITFYDICHAVDDPVVKSECVLFKRPCDREHPCAFHGRFSKTKARLIEFLEVTTLSQ
jgi:Rrf2 family transcriptional regulator, iron-sulfur cluster assembly transcription factor